MKSNWRDDFDFGTGRVDYDIEAILDDLGIDDYKLSANGEWFNLCCPIHDDHAPSLGIALGSGDWNCFVCGSGNINSFIQQVLDMSEEEATVWLSSRKDDEPRDVYREQRISKKREFEQEDIKFSKWIREVARKKWGWDHLDIALQIYDGFVNDDKLEDAEDYRKNIILGVG